MKRRVARFKGQKAIFMQLRDVWSNPRVLLGFANLFVLCKRQPDLEALVTSCIDQSIGLLDDSMRLTSTSTTPKFFGRLLGYNEPEFSELTTLSPTCQIKQKSDGFPT